MKELKCHSIEVRVFSKEHRTFLARVDAKIFFGGFMVEIRDMNLIKGQKGYFLSMPSRPYEIDGKKKYFNYCLLNESLTFLVQDEAIKKYEAMTKKESNWQSSGIGKNIWEDEKPVAKTEAADDEPWEDIDL
jgi:DNA-binding cell septation regulator SpoVG